MKFFDIVLIFMTTEILNYSTSILCSSTGLKHSIMGLKFHYQL